MGILTTLLKHTVGKAVAYKASEVAIKVCDNASNKLDARISEKKNIFPNAPNNGHSRLIVGQNPYTFKETFYVFDEMQEAKYMVKGRLISSTHNLSLYDTGGKILLGRVREKHITFRSPFSLEHNPKDFVIEIGGKKLGKMKSRYAFGKSKFEFTFNKWVVQGNISGLKYKIVSGQQTIMEINEQLGTIGDTYHVDITNPNDEILCILVLLAIDSSRTSKSNDSKRAFRYKTRRWL